MSAIEGRGCACDRPTLGRFPPGRFAARYRPVRSRAPRSLGENAQRRNLVGSGRCSGEQAARYKLPDHLNIYFETGRIILFAVAACPSVDDPYAERRTIKPDAIDTVSCPRTIKMKPSILEGYEPLVVHIGGDMAEPHPLSVCVGK
jgi:hypothetical protein